MYHILLLFIVTKPYLLYRKFANGPYITYLLTYVAITTRLSGFGLPNSLSPGAFALRAPPVVHTKLSQGLFNLVLPTRTPAMTVDLIKHSSRRRCHSIRS